MHVPRQARLPLLVLVTAATLTQALAHAGTGPAAVGVWRRLNDGHDFPSVSLGTCCGSTPSAGVASWVAAGGLGIDTSRDYMKGADEGDIAQILAKIGANRSNVYITTKITAGCGSKLSDCSADPAIAMASVKQSLKELQTSYIDMVLLHRPCEQFSQKCSIAAKLSPCSGPVPIRRPSEANAALWQGLQQAKSLGLVRSIGTSNYNVAELKALPGPLVPAVNQCEMSVQGYDNATLSYCEAQGITYESYGALRGCPFTSPVLGAIADAHGVTAAQVCLRWVLQRGAVVAAGTGNNASTAAAYAKENVALFNFALSGSDMMKLNDMQL